MAGHDVKYGTHSTRRSFSRINEVLDLPDLIEIQTESFDDFVKVGLGEAFQEVFPIDSFNGNIEMEFVSYEMREPKYTIDEARKHDANYSAPVFVTFRLINKETGELKTQEVFFGDFPKMTPMGTFIINGAERLIVSQLVRSPGSYFHQQVDKNGRESFAHTTIPNRGAWLELDTDAKNIGYVKIDRSRKLLFTTMIRAIGFGSDSEILDIFGESELMNLTLEKDVQKDPSDSSVEEALKDIYDRLRPGEPKTADSSRSLLIARFFDAHRYDFVAVGRYKTNKKLALPNRLLGLTLAETIADPETGEIVAEKGTLVTSEMLSALTEAFDNGAAKVTLYPSEQAPLTEPIEIQTVRVENPTRPGETFKIVSNAQPDDRDRILKPADILANINYWLGLFEGIGHVDDIDHLGNRRIRCVGELFQNQVRVGLSRMERVIRERMSSTDNENMTPAGLLNVRPVTAALKEFMGSSQLSQFMDQHNPLSEISHKRRFSALGPGGLSRDRASVEVRDVHYTHYGRMCPIETPEGPNIGLINNLASYGKVNKYGFLMSPYRKVDKKTGKLTEEIAYMTADEEDQFIIAQANSRLTEDNHFASEMVMARHAGNNIEVLAEKADYMDVSPKQVVAVATACIPFLENDDSNRALMGANMQRQAVPLIDPHSPYVGTGMEHRIAHDSGASILSEYDGTVEFVDAREIRVRRADKSGNLDVYHITKYRRSNSGTSYNQRALVKEGDIVSAGEIIADGPAMENGEMALGQNPLVAFMTWEGYNFEDAVIMSDRLVKEDVYTSIAIEEYESETRDTKLGPEEITRELPNVGEDALRHLDENGVIRIGAEVKEGDILVGKVTPKGESDPTPDELLLRAIFGEKSREVRDTSLRVPHGADGIVHDIHVFKRENGDELPTGVSMLVRVYIAQKRKIQVGDKMAGRHGNKGVVSRIVPVEDMPYLPDGTPVDIMLNPLGVPSRMNIGQVMELHLGMAARTLGIHIATPVFDGARSSDIWSTVKEAGMADDAKTVLYDGRTGEPFDNRVSVGVMYMIKLHHMVDDKIHARSVGPYSLVTQQPLGGKAQFGGQRFGEMEVWALEAYGAANVLQEILTYKSDDIIGRTKAYEAIVKGERIPQPGLPESFRVLVKELQALGLDMKVLDKQNKPIELREMEEINLPKYDNTQITSEMLDEQEENLKNAIAAETALIESEGEDN
ncbi:MAG: DNA-directed RNA polymerase subunit beta [Streptococcaceae bacterium]|nr:DNA-directed RNA polymerase subunit beta [Streptococcaceae bacterium]